MNKLKLRKLVYSVQSMSSLLLEYKVMCSKEDQPEQIQKGQKNKYGCRKFHIYMVRMQ